MNHISSTKRQLPPTLCLSGKSIAAGVPAILYFCLFFCLQLLFPRHAAAQIEEDPGCESAYSHAANLFFNASFRQAAEILNLCLSSDMLLDVQRAELYLLLAKIYFAEQNQPLAAEALDHLFSLRPDYEMDKFLPPPFVEFAENIREIQSAEEVLDREMVPKIPLTAEQKLNNRRMLLIGGGGLFAITAVAIMTSGRPDRPDFFPPAPGPPSSNR